MLIAIMMRLLLLAILACATIGWVSFLSAQDVARNTSQVGVGPTNVRKMFEKGQSALESGHLQEAEQAFRSVLAMAPRSAGAYADLGVVYMRGHRWKSALAMFLKARQLSPEVPGIRLNIGLTFYHENRFREAIPPFESVLRESPASVQARYLLGLCYFFTQGYAAATNTLKSLKEQQSNDLNFLYVLEISAWKAKQPELEQWALRRFIEIGRNHPEFHLLMGKAHMNRGEYDEALHELSQAAQAAPRLPFLHFTLGSVYMKERDIDHAKSEFFEDSRIEPDIAYNYDQLGLIEFKYQHHPKQAEQYFRRALQLDPELTSSHYQLACLYLSEGRLTGALSEIDRARALAPQNSSVHYVRGRILQRLGRIDEAKDEWRMVRHQQEEDLEGSLEPSKLLEGGSSPE